MFHDIHLQRPLGMRTHPKQLLQRLLAPVFNGIKIDNRLTAMQIFQLIPAQCPFERDICIFGHKLFHIPPLCNLNPAYEEFVALRFRALCYLADHCGEDVSQYCS